MIHSTAWRKGTGVHSLWPHIYHSSSRATAALSSTSKEMRLCWKEGLVSPAKGVCNVKHGSWNNQTYVMGIILALWFLGISSCSPVLLSLMQHLKTEASCQRGEGTLMTPGRTKGLHSSLRCLYWFPLFALEPTPEPCPGGKRKMVSGAPEGKEHEAFRTSCLCDQVHCRIGKVVLLKHREKIRTIEGVERQKGS